MSIIKMHLPEETAMSGTQYPEWWPENPYFDSAMSIKSDTEYAALLPDPGLRTAVSWYIGNRTWKLASQAIFEEMDDERPGLESRLESALDRIKKLEAALRPFADKYASFVNRKATYTGDLSWIDNYRNAARVLGEENRP